MHLRSGLGWLHGFPIASGAGWIDWISIATQTNLTATRLRVDRSRLQRLQMALTSLTTEHEDDLEQLFDDPEEWVQSAGQILRALKAVIHEGQPLAQAFPLASLPALSSVRSKCLEFEADWPRLSPLLNAVLWMSSLEPGGAGARLSAVWTEAQALDRFLKQQPGEEGLVLALQWVILCEEDDGPAAATLLHLLSDPRLHELPLSGLVSHYEKMLVILSGVEAVLQLEWSKRKRHLPGKFSVENPFPTNKIKTIASTFLARLVRLDPEKRQAELRLFHIIADESQFQEWLKYWKEAGPLIRRAEKILNLPMEKMMNAPPSDLGGLIGKLSALQGRIPAEVDFQETWSEIWEVRHRPLEVHLARFTQAIAAWEPVKELIPNGFAFVQGLLKLFNLYHFNDINIVKILEYLHAAAKTQLGNEAYRSALGKIVERQSYGELIGTGQGALEDADTPPPPPPKKFWHAYFRSLSFLALQRIEPKGLVVALKMAANAAIIFQFDAKKIDRYLSAVDFAEIKSVGYSSNLAARILIHLHLLGWSFAKSSAILDAMTYGGQSSADGAAFDFFLGFLRRHDLENDVRDSLPHLDVEPLAQLACAAHDASQLAEDLKPPMRQDAGGDQVALRWIEDYPAPLHAALKKLAAFAPTNQAQVGKSLGQKAANKILEETFPSREKLEGEIAKLSVLLGEQQAQPNSKRQLADEEKKRPLAVRLENLKRRLSHPAAVSSKRMENLNKKLEAAYAQLVYDDWLAHFQNALESGVRRELGLSTPPAWLQEPENRHLLAQIMKLDETDKRLGLKILAKRCGPPPWDFVDEPENRAFLETLKSQGLNVDPWVNPVSPGWVQAANGKMIEVSFSGDPLEVFRMGEYFKTCLGFEGCNFFSTITNFVDVNKQVLFAKTEKGTVIGRSLLALTENGWLQTFQAYSHDNSIEWDKIVGQIAQDLAEKMGTVVTPSGEVPSLVAKSWYADPPRLLIDQVSPIEKMDFIAMTLSETPVEEFLDRFREAIKPIALPNFLKVWLLNGNLVGLLFALGEEKMSLLYGPIESALPMPDPNQSWWSVVVYARKAGLKEWPERMFKKYVLPTLAPEIKRNGFANDHAAELLLWMADHNPSLALRTLRQAHSPWSTGSDEDEEETDSTKRHLLAMIHAKLGRHQLADRLKKKIDSTRD